MRKRLMLSTAVAALCLAAQMATAAPIHDAAAKGNLATVKKLIKATPGAVNSKDKTGATPLHHAVVSRSKAVVEFLIANKANIEAKKTDGVRPIHVAAALDQLEIMELLVARKADINAADASGRTPLSIARQKADAKMIEFLKTHGAIDPGATTAPNPAATTTTPAPQPPAAVTSRITPNLIKLSTELMQAFQDGNYSKLTENFDDNMKASMREDRLAMVRNAMTTQMGALKKTSNPRQSVKDGFDIVLISCEFANATVDVQFSYNANHQVAGFFVVQPQ